jgi:hypothetical protein
MFGLKVVGWCSFASDYPTKKYNEKELKKVLKVVKKEISKNNYSFSGALHQNASNGVPVLSDGSCLRCSMRFWGEIMKDVYSKKLKQELSYMDFYMSSVTDIKLPDVSDIKVKELKLDYDYPGYTTSTDNQLISDAASLGFPLMTTDQVLKKIFDDM